MKRQEDNRFERLIDSLQESAPATDKELSCLLIDEHDMTAWQDLQDIDEALLRRTSSCPDASQAWEEFKLRHQARHTFHSPVLRIFKVACSIAALILLLWTISLPFRKGNHEIASTPSVSSQPVARTSAPTPATSHSYHASHPSTIMHTQATNAREIHAITLSDGTRVWLNAKSSLRYPDHFSGDTRVVELQGEAYFKVAHDSLHPFIVKANGVETKVLGTEFNVKCYSSDNTHVTLVKGMVEVTGNGECVRIHPNEDAQLTADGLSVKTINVNDFASWHTGTISFDHSTLRDILQQLGSWYDVNVSCTDKGLLDKHYHYSYNVHHSLNEALQLLNASSDVNATFRNGSIVIE